MKSNAKFLSLLAGFAALSVVSAVPVFAQSGTPDAPPPPPGMRHPDFLKLTAEQRAKMEQIHQNTRSQIDAVLTAEQKAKLQQERANRRPPASGEQRGTRPSGEAQGNRENRRPPSPFASLNLTTEQRSKIESIMRASKAQMDAVLTAEQKAQLQQHRRQGRPPAPENQTP